MPNPSPSLSPSRLGSVEDVNGSSVSVKLADNTPGGLVFVSGEAYQVGQVGGFVRIPCGYVDLYGVISQVGAGAAPSSDSSDLLLGNRWLRVELVGQGRKGTRFERGISQYPSIGDPVHVVTESDLKTVYAPGDEEGYVSVGRVASAESIRAFVDANKLVSRHSAVVGSTGAGKSNAVASLISALSEPGRFKASRVVLFDLHGEYARAFGSSARVLRIGADLALGEKELYVPFWALNAEELVSLAFGNVAGTPLALLHERLLDARRNSKPAKTAHSIPAASVTIDSPLPFSIYQLWYDLYSTHCASHTVTKNQNQNESTKAYVAEGTPPTKLVGNGDALERPKFRALKNEKEDPEKIYAGQFAELPRAHLDTLESKLRDPRLQFLFRPGDWAVDSNQESKADLDLLLSEWIGASKPITVFDLSGIPATIVDDLVGVVLRILYDAVFWGRLKAEGGRHRPLLVVLEEAHIYLGTQGKSRASSAARRIAKEGRKYGAGLMLVSQRPAEIDSTILSQCGTIVAMRLTNESDRSQITSCSSDNLKSLFSMLPILRTGEALIVGDAVNMPIRAILDRPTQGKRPDSEDPFVVVPKDSNGKRIRAGGWTEDVSAEDFKPLIEAWRRQDPKATSAQVQVVSKKKK